MFDTPDLLDIRSRVHFHEYSTSNPLYIERLMNAVPPGEAPAILLQDSEGTVLCKLTGNSLPGTYSELRDQLREAASHTNRGCCQVNATVLLDDDARNRLNRRLISRTNHTVHHLHLESIQQFAQTYSRGRNLNLSCHICIPNVR